MNWTIWLALQALTRAVEIAFFALPERTAAGGKYPAENQFD
jgi:hypothetical protein